MLFPSIKYIHRVVQLLPVLCSCLALRRLGSCQGAPSLSLPDHLQSWSLWGPLSLSRLCRTSSPLESHLPRSPACLLLDSFLRALALSIPGALYLHPVASRNSQVQFPLLQGKQNISFTVLFGQVVVVVQLLGHVQLFATPRTIGHQAILSFTVSRSLLGFMSIESVCYLTISSM